MLSPAEIVARADTLRGRNTERDSRMGDILAIREGRWDEVAPGLFPAEFPKPVVANMIETAAKDFADQIGPLPRFNCESANMVSDRARQFADKRSKIVQYYATCSNLQPQMFSGVDRLMSYSFMAFMVEPDYDEQMPKILIGDNYKAYYQLDRFGRRTLYYCHRFRRRVDELCVEFPEAADQLMAVRFYSARSDQEVEVIRWWDDDQQALVTAEGGVLLDRVPNPIGRCLVRVVEMPKLGKSPRGQYDDVVWVQIARGMMGIYLLQAMDESVNAPLAVPDDVQEFSLGPKELIRASDPSKIGKVPLQVPAGLFQEAANLLNEQRIGSRYPEGRSGSIDASIITGQGVEALEGTFSSVVKTAQQLLAPALSDVMSMCLEVDATLWPDKRATVRGTDSGAPYEITYTPSKDISGDYSVEATYGLTAGLDPNRALVWLLQVRAAGGISMDTLRRQLPVDLDVTREAEKIEIETQREALTQAVAGYAQAVPMIAAQGGDPSEVVAKVAEFVRLIQRGTAVEEAAAKVFPPPAPPPEAPPGAPGAAGGGIFDQQTGLPQGIAPGQAGMGRGGAQDLLMSLSGLTPSGKPNLQSTVSRRQPA